MSNPKLEALEAMVAAGEAAEYEFRMVAVGRVAPPPAGADGSPAVPVAAAAPAPKFEFKMRCFVVDGDMWFATSAGQILGQHIVIRELAHGVGLEPGVLVAERSEGFFGKLPNKLAAVVRLILTVEGGPLGGVIDRLLGKTGRRVVEVIKRVHRGDDAVATVARALGNERVATFAKEIQKARDDGVVTPEEFLAAVEKARKA